VFTSFIALSSQSRIVVGVDIDAEKIKLAQGSLRGLHSGEAMVSFEHRPSGEIPTVGGGWNAIVFADVLYLLAPDDRSRLVSECAAALAPGGLLIVKEVDTKPRFKARIAQLQEFLATKVLRITDGDALDFPSVAEIETLLTSNGLATRVARLDKGYFHPHCVVVGTKASS
jgi:2-polyprenyl-3-methyl-5-hydroxy-6-metoxy-1,4-benzoquinol methylase